jgi:hypothetical protein
LAWIAPLAKKRRKNPMLVAAASSTNVRRHDVARANQAQAARPAHRINRCSCTSSSSAVCGEGRPLAGTTLGTMMK